MGKTLSESLIFVFTDFARAAGGRRKPATELLPVAGAKATAVGQTLALVPGDALFFW
jgi:hypothetical protein